MGEKLQQLIRKVQRRRDLLQGIERWTQEGNITLARFLLRRLNAEKPDEPLTQADLDPNTDDRMWG